MVMVDVMNIQLPAVQRDAPGPRSYRKVQCLSISLCLSVGVRRAIVVFFLAHLALLLVFVGSFLFFHFILFIFSSLGGHFLNRNA